MAMVNVNTESVLSGPYRKNTAWERICDFARYASIMESVDEVRVHERNETTGKSEWFVTIEEAPLTWIERDFFDKRNNRVRFESIYGDFETFNGEWNVIDNGGNGIKISFSVDYDLGIPVIEEVLGHILKEKMKTNVDMMLAAIRDELGKSAHEERSEERVSIKKPVDIKAGRNSFRATVINLSRRGMMIRMNGPSILSDLSGPIEFCDIALQNSAIHTDLASSAVRLVFDRPLDISDYNHLIASLRESPEIISEMIQVYEVITSPKVECTGSKIIS